MRQIKSARSVSMAEFLAYIKDAAAVRAEHAAKPLEEVRMVSARASSIVHGRRSGGVAIALAGSTAVVAILGATLFLLQGLLPGLRVLPVFGGALL
jgi:hypothetical protein